MNNFSSVPRKHDTILLLVTLLLLTAGIAMIYSSSSIMALERYKDGQYFLKRQFFYILLGLVSMMILRKTSYQKLGRYAYVVLAISVICLVLLFVPHVGVRVNNATRWLRLGLFTFQVSELVKVAVVLFLAHYLAKKEVDRQDFTHGFLVPLCVTLFVMA